MGSFAARLKLGLFGIRPSATSFAARGFRRGPAQVTLEGVGRTFVQGYRAALAASGLADLERRLGQVEGRDRGFAYEGASMALSVLDLVLPWGHGRMPRFLRELASPHVYMVHIGLGLACARLGRRVRPILARIDPLLGWLVLDGYGFHEGYFRWPRAVGRQRVPAALEGYERRAFDQGLGRSLWFLAGGDPGAAADAIEGFPSSRRGDLWSGLGLASAYAGGIGEEGLTQLRARAGPHLVDVAQGVAFAAGARWRAGNPAPQTELAAGVLCGRSAEQLAIATEAEREALPVNDSVPPSPPGWGPSDAVPRYELWRQRVRSVAAVAP